MGILFSHFFLKSIQDKSWADIVLNMAITWISWGAAPGYINTAPLGLKGSCLNYKSFSKSPIYSLLEYTQQN
jgi:hypothetical protein